jgi:hypothetical protein
VHQGALYLGVDAWQSPNGFDILGIVIYRLVDNADGNIDLEAMPLDFVQLSQSHTGKYLEKIVSLVVDKFSIKDKVSRVSLATLIFLIHFLKYLIVSRYVALSATMPQITR